MTELQSMGLRAAAAAKVLACASSELKNSALAAISQALIDNMDTILAANAEDIAAAKATSTSYLAQYLSK